MSDNDEDLGNTQFEPMDGDDDNLWNVEKILNEKGKMYLVAWEGIDPATGKRWEPSWVEKSACTNELIREWKREKMLKPAKPRGRPKGPSSNKPSSSKSVSSTSSKRSSRSQMEVIVEIPKKSTKRSHPVDDDGSSNSNNTTSRKRRRLEPTSPEIPLPAKEAKKPSSLRSSSKPNSKGKRAVSFEPELSVERDRFSKLPKKRTPLPDLFEDEREDSEVSVRKRSRSRQVVEEDQEYVEEEDEPEEEEEEEEEVEGQVSPPPSPPRVPTTTKSAPPSGFHDDTDYDEPPAPRTPSRSNPPRSTARQKTTESSRDPPPHTPSPPPPPPSPSLTRSHSATHSPQSKTTSPKTKPSPTARIRTNGNLPSMQTKSAKDTANILMKEMRKEQEAAKLKQQREEEEAEESDQRSADSGMEFPQKPKPRVSATFGPASKQPTNGKRTNVHVTIVNTKEQPLGTIEVTTSTKPFSNPPSGSNKRPSGSPSKASDWIEGSEGPSSSSLSLARKVQTPKQMKLPSSSLSQSLSGSQSQSQEKHRDGTAAKVLDISIVPETQETPSTSSKSQSQPQGQSQSQPLATETPPRSQASVFEPALQGEPRAETQASPSSPPVPQISIHPSPDAPPESPRRRDILSGPISPLTSSRTKSKPGPKTKTLTFRPVPFVTPSRFKSLVKKNGKQGDNDPPSSPVESFSTPSQNSRKQRDAGMESIDIDSTGVSLPKSTLESHVDQSQEGKQREPSIGLDDSFVDWSGGDADQGDLGDNEMDVDKRVDTGARKGVSNHTEWQAHEEEEEEEEEAEDEAEEADKNVEEKDEEVEVAKAREPAKPDEDEDEEESQTQEDEEPVSQEKGSVISRIKSIFSARSITPVTPSKANGPEGRKQKPRLETPTRQPTINQGKSKIDTVLPSLNADELKLLDDAPKAIASKSPSKATSRATSYLADSATPAPQDDFVPVHHELSVEDQQLQDLLVQYIPNLAHEPHHRVVQLSNLLSFNAAEIQRLNEAVRARDEAYQSREKSYQEQLARRQMNYHKHTAEVEELAASYKTKYEKNLEQFAHLDMIRTVYETASQRNTELEIENSTLVERNSILEGQVKDGINQNRIFYETQIQALKAALSITTSRATLFQQLAHRTEQFNVRQRAAQEPVLRREVEVLTAEVTQLRNREEELVEQINSEVRAKRDDEALDGLRMEVMRLGDLELELRKKAKVLKTELENTRKAWQNRELSLQRTERVYAEDADKVLLCRWAINEQGDSCMVERQNRKELQEHVMHDHLQYFESVDTPDISF